MTLRFFKDGQPVEVDEVCGTNADAKQLAASFTASSEHSPYARIETPKRLGIRWVTMILGRAAKAKDRHVPVIGSEVGQPEPEGTP